MHVFGWIVLGWLGYRLLLAMVAVGMLLAGKLAKAIKDRIDNWLFRYAVAIGTMTAEMLRESQGRGRIWALK